MDRRSDQRINYIYIVFLSLFIIIALKIIYLQVFKSNFFQDLAQNQHYRILKLEGKRGKIFDRKNRVLATGMNCYSIFADPYFIADPEHTAKAISFYLEVSEPELASRLRKKKRFVWVKRKVSLEEKQKIETLKLKGIGFIRREKRFYPQDNLASCLVGIVDIDNKGLDGLELLYNSYLSGKEGLVRVLQDSNSQELMLFSQIVTPQKGADLTLNIDAQIQYWAKVYLKAAIEEYSAQSGSVVVMDASNGGVLAIVNYPDFDPNDLSSVISENMRNRAASDMFEPGSVFKVTTLLAAIGEGKFSDNDKFFCEQGQLKVPGTILHDWHPYGELTFREVFMKSSNIGVAKIVNALGSNVFFRYIKLLEYGKVTGIDLPYEVKGSIKPLNRWSKTSPYIVPIGQEIGVNLLQLVRTFAVIVNGGYLVKPQVVKDICSQGFCRNIPANKRKILPDTVTERAKEILIATVDEGTGKAAKIKNRAIGGKTGTAQKYDPEIKRYSPDKYRATFVGFIADLDPPLVIGVSIDEPKKSHFGGVVAAPAFRKIAEKVIKYIENTGI